MKKYLIFAWYDWEARGGINDLQNSTDSFEEALIILKTLKDSDYRYDIIRIIDRDTLEILKDE